MTFAPCLEEFSSGEGGPPQVVVVRIIDVDPNTDLEGDDDFVPFYDNHADIYGHVRIEGETFAIPKLEDSDHPYWDYTGDKSAVFEKAVTANPVPLSIDIWEADSGATGGDDHVKINPAFGKHQLDLLYDMCRNTVSGDLTASAQGRLESDGGPGKGAASIRFTVGLKNGRPPTTNDLALMNLDLIQVVPNVGRLVGRKGTVAVVRIANNHPFEVNTDLRVQISGGGVSLDETVPITVEAEAVKKEYLFTANPIAFPAAGAPYQIAAIAEINDPGSDDLDPSDCRRANDSIQARIQWKVVTTNLNFSLLWAKVGLLLDVANYVSDADFDEIHGLGTSFIGATYPLRDPTSTKSPIDIPPPPATGATEFLLAVLSGFPYSPDNLEPVLFVFELNAIAALTGYDRLMGVLPNKDWFKRFDKWADVTGFSLGEFAPRAVIFLPRQESGSSSGTPWILPAHELGHTFGLSTDARLKESWVCDVDWPVLGNAACGLVGGFDEYRHEDAALKKGNPANGYWVRYGSEPAVIAALPEEQCDSHCLMGSNSANPHLSWSTKGQWIDAADYNRLVDKLAVHPDPEVIYMSGMISWTDQIYLGPWYRLDHGVPDHTRTRGMYQFRFVDEDGDLLSEVGLPVAWNHAEFHKPLPITFFGITVEYPRGAKTVEVWNRGTGKLLASKDVDLSAPEVRLKEPRWSKRAVRLNWDARAEEGRGLKYTVLIGDDGEHWWPVAHDQDGSTVEIDTSAFEPGTYHAKVLAINEVRVGESNQVVIRI